MDGLSPIDNLFINKGWTSLWDGVRMANETLGTAQGDGIEFVTQPNAGEFCTTARKQGIVLFTDGAENNSANQQLQTDAYPGDGIDTTFQDLLSLRVGGSRAPIYAVGLGDQIDARALSELATSSPAQSRPHVGTRQPGRMPKVTPSLPCGSWPPSPHRR